MLMDAQMPGMDGFEATRLIRTWEEGSRHVAIIGVTAHASKDGRDSCYAAGMDDYLSKPYMLEDLAELVRKWAAKSIQPVASEVEEEIRIQPTNVCSLDKAILNGIRSLQTDDRPDLLERIFATYLDGSRKLMDQLVGARQAGSLKDMQAAAHALKSSSGNIGATEFSSLASDLERACSESNQSHAVDLAKRMEATYIRVVNAVQCNLDRKSA